MSLFLESSPPAIGEVIVFLYQFEYLFRAWCLNCLFDIFEPIHRSGIATLGIDFGLKCHLQPIGILSNYSFLRIALSFFIQQAGRFFG